MHHVSQSQICDTEHLEDPFRGSTSTALCTIYSSGGCEGWMSWNKFHHVYTVPLHTYTIIIVQAFWLGNQAESALMSLLVRSKPNRGHG